MTSSDLSASGVGLSLAPHLGTGLIRQLLSGKKKARLAIELRTGETINVFGRLIWAGLGTGTTQPQGRAGFSFIDISASTFQFLREYVDSRLADTAELADSSPGLGPPR